MMSKFDMCKFPNFQKPNNNIVKCTERYEKTPESNHDVLVASQLLM